MRSFNNLILENKFEYKKWSEKLTYEKIGSYLLFEKMIFDSKKVLLIYLGSIKYHEIIRKKIKKL